MTRRAIARARRCRPESRVRVLLVVEQLRRAVPGGIGRYAVGLLQGLADMARRGEQTAEVTLYASRAPRHGDPLAAYGLPVISSRLPGPALTRAWDHAVVDVPRGFDVVHAVSLAMPPARHSPLVVTVHDLAWRWTPDAVPARGRRWHEAALRRVERRAAAVVVPSRPVARDVTAAGVVAQHVSVIAHGCDHLPPADHAAAATLLRRLGVEGEFLLSVGTLEPRKNLARLVDAYGRARKSLPRPWPLVIVGPTGWSAVHGRGDGGFALRHPGPGVVAAGAVDDATLCALYEQARLLVYVPLTEGFGFPPVEAMRHGTVVVSSPLPSLDGAGLVVDPGRVDDIATGLVRAATDDALRRDLVVRGADRVAGLTWAASARAHVGLWQSAMVGSPIR